MEIMKKMKINRMNQKLAYILTCIMTSAFLFGCKEQGATVSVFDGLPESTYLTEAKASIESKKPLAVAFTAEWCPHCRNYKPIFLEVKDELKDKATFINIDVDDPNGSKISGRFQVRGVPTTAFVRADGSVFKLQVGEINKEDLTKIINDLARSKRKRRGEPVAPFPIEPVEVKEPPKEDVKPQDIIKKEEPGEVESEKKEEAAPEPMLLPQGELEDSKEPAGTIETKPSDLENPSVPESPEVPTSP